MTTALVLIALLVPASAAAQRTTVPPGQSEADQYFETVPDGKGDSSLDTGGKPSDALSESELAALERLGGDGAVAAQLAAATNPVGAGATARPAAGDGDGSAGAPDAGGAADEGGSPDAEQGPAAGAALALAPSRDGLGWLLWLLMLATAAALLAFAVMRRRTRRR